MTQAPSPVESEALTHETMWRDVRRLVDRAFVALEKDWARHLISCGRVVRL